ncbi:hypothetical protein D3C79_1114720 [compost metagenome]
MPVDSGKAKPPPGGLAWLLRNTYHTLRFACLSGLTVIFYRYKQRVVARIQRQAIRMRRQRQGLETF